MPEETSSFIMDSGAFLDVIPIILNYLDLRSLIQLSKTCYFWKQRIYTDLKLWRNIIELPYIGQTGDITCGSYSLESVIEAKLWSMILPPEDPRALEKVLYKMASSQESIQRFKLVEKIQFKNYIHTDESLRLTALLFPSLKQISFEGNLLTIIGVEYIAKSCQKLKHIEFYKCSYLNMSNVFPLFNTLENRMNLERIFFYDDLLTPDKKLPIEAYLSYMESCQRCGLYFNKIKNDKEMLCLYHPGNYSGNDHSCSSYSCCGSNTPSYPSTLGCQYTYHTTVPESSGSNMLRTYELHNGHPEYMFEKFDQKMFSLPLTERRLLNKYYRQWYIEDRPDESK